MIVANLSTLFFHVEEPREIGSGALEYIDAQGVSHSFGASMTDLLELLINGEACNVTAYMSSAATNSVESIEGYAIRSMYTSELIFNNKKTRYDGGRDFNTGITTADQRCLGLEAYKTLKSYHPSYATSESCRVCAHTKHPGQYIGLGIFAPSPCPECNGEYNKNVRIDLPHTFVWCGPSGVEGVPSGYRQYVVPWDVSGAKMQKDCLYTSEATPLVSQAKRLLRI